MTPIQMQQLRDEINRRFAARLPQIRAARGVSRRELAERVGLSQNAIGLAEGIPGRALRRVDVGEMFAIAEALAVPPALFVRAAEPDLSALKASRS